MTDLPVGVQVYLLTASCTALLAHGLWTRLWRRYLIASLAAGLASPFMFLLVCVLHGDAMQSVPVAIYVFFALIGFGIAVAVGLPFLWWRRR